MLIIGIFLAAAGLALIACAPNNQRVAGAGFMLFIGSLVLLLIAAPV